LRNVNLDNSLDNYRNQTVEFRLRDEIHSCKRKIDEGNKNNALGKCKFKQKCILTDQVGGKTARE